jgi:acyl-CoA synthetase
MSIPSGYTPAQIEEYTRAGYWANDLIPDYLDRNAARRPERLAYLEGERRYTWQECHRLVNRLAVALLELGLRKHDRVCIYLPDWIEAQLLYAALSKIGVITVTISIGQGASELDHMLERTEAVAIVTPTVWRGTDYAARVRSLRPSAPQLEHHVVVRGEPEPDTLALDALMSSSREEGTVKDRLARCRPGANEVFWMNFSSGTTGAPKCVLHTPNRWIYFSKLAIDGARMTDEDVVLALVPGHSGFGFWSSHVCPMLLGTRTLLQERFDAEEALKIIEREKVTFVSAVTTQFVKMLEVRDFAKYDLSSWRVLYTGGQDVPFEKVRELESKTGCTVLQFYGSIETGGISRTVLGETLEQRSRTVGRPIPEMQVKLFDPESGEEVTSKGQAGEVGCKGPTMGSGYYRDPEANAKLYNRAGWMLTCDIGSLGEDGYLRLVGRVKDIIIRGGQNISAAEVEDAIFGHPKVADVAVVAMPDPVFGEKSCAYVVAKAAQQVSLAELTTFLVERGMAKYKLPERLELIEELPLSPGGKVQKNLLRDDIAEKLEAQGKP